MHERRHLGNYECADLAPLRWKKEKEVRQKKKTNCLHSYLITQLMALVVRKHSESGEI